MNYRKGAECPRCHRDVMYNGSVSTPPIIAQMRGDTNEEFWARDRYTCLPCCLIFDVRRVDGAIMSVPFRGMLEIYGLGGDA